MLIWPGTDLKTVEARANKLREKVEETRVLYQEKHLPTVTISAGVACYPDDERDIQALLRQADEALYAAKDRGRNQVRIYGEKQTKLPTAKPKPLPPTSPMAAE